MKWYNFTNVGEADDGSTALNRLEKEGFDTCKIK